MRPTVILCMAGLYRRFREAGYTQPKFLLPVHGRTVLQWVIETLGPERLLLIANHRDAAHEPAIRAALMGAGLPQAAVRFIADTSGQAETAAVGAREALALGWAGPLLFHNIDTVVKGRDLDRIGTQLAHNHGFVDVFPSDSPAYSYVALREGYITEIAEKVVISPHATSGLYGFASPALYLEAASSTDQRSGGEFYISDVYATMLARGDRLVINEDHHHHETLVLGTPAEYEAYIAGRG